MLVPKKNGKWRLCIDYRKVNDLTVKDSYSLTYIDEIFDSLDGAQIFTTMDQESFKNDDHANANDYIV